MPERGRVIRIVLLVLLCMLAGIGVGLYGISHPDSVIVRMVPAGVFFLAVGLFVLSYRRRDEMGPLMGVSVALAIASLVPLTGQNSWWGAALMMLAVAITSVSGYALMKQLRRRRPGGPSAPSLNGP